MFENKRQEKREKSSFKFSIEVVTHFVCLIVGNKYPFTLWNLYLGMLFKWKFFI